MMRVVKTYIMNRKGMVMKNNTAKIREKRNNLNKLVNGDEPTININSQYPEVELARAYTWYNTNHTIEEGREWLFSYLKSKKYSQDIIDNVKQKNIPMVFCSIARLLSRNIQLPERTINNFTKFLEPQVNNVVTKKRNTYNVKPITVDTKIDIILQNIEDATDQLLMNYTFDYSLYNDIKNQQIKSPSVKEIYERILPRINQVIEMADIPNSSINEYYAKLTKAQKKTLIAFYKMLDTDCRKALQATKVVRQNKKKKTVSNDKVLKSFKYKKEDNSLKILSVEPLKILTSSTLVVYNTKYKRMTVFVAKEGEMLAVKGTSILNYDENKSGAKRVKKPEEAISLITSGTSNSILKTFAKLKSTPQTITNRINEDTLLLRVA